MHIRIISFILLSFIFPVAPADPAPSGNPRNILVLFAFDPSTPPYHLITDGLREELKDKYGDGFTMHLEYLQIDKYPAHEYPGEKFELYNRKYEDVKIDLLILIGVGIVDAIKDYADEYLKNLPAITIDYDFSRYGIENGFSLNKKNLEIRLKMNIERTITKALGIFPATTSLYFISGISRMDSLYYRISVAASEYFDERYQVSFITGEAMDEVIARVRNLPPNSLIIVSGFNTDKNRVPYYTQEAVRLIATTANSPVFTYTDIGFGDGSFGGDFISFRKTGEIAGRWAVRILNGEDPSTMRITETDYYVNEVDWRQLKKWKNSEDRKSLNGYTIKFRDESFFDKYKWYLSVALLFLVIQSTLIVRLVRLNILQKKMTRQLIEADRKYMDIIREDRILRMGMLTASLSHELNQPLTAILSTAQAGKRFIDANNLDPKLYREIFDNIVEDDNRAASILRSIRGLMKLEKRDKEKVNLNILISEVAELYRSRATELNSGLDLNLHDEPLFVIADAIQIQQVLLNLISNAAQATERNKGTTKTIIVSEIAEERNAIVRVRDYGPGIDESVSKRLFEPFVTSRKEGVGIGLSVSRLIIEDHNGRISARNMPDGGAEFSFTLKLADES